jgi:hypothetical protein
LPSDPAPPQRLCADRAQAPRRHVAFDARAVLESIAAQLAGVAAPEAHLGVFGDAPQVESRVELGEVVAAAAFAIAVQLRRDDPVAPRVVEVAQGSLAPLGQRQLEGLLVRSAAELVLQQVQQCLRESRALVVDGGVGARREGLRRGGDCARCAVLGRNGDGEALTAAPRRLAHHRQHQIREVRLAREIEVAELALQVVGEAILGAAHEEHGSGRRRWLLGARAARPD